MKKLSAQAESDQRGVIQPILIIGGAVIGIIIILVATGTLKFSGYVKVDDSNKQADLPSVQTEESAPAQKPQSAAKLNSENYTDTNYGFTISYPEGWKVREQTNNVTMFKPSETKGADQADALVSVVADKVGDNKDMKLASIADIHKTFLKKQFTSVDIIGEKETKVGAEDGYELEFNSVINSEKMHGRYIVIKGAKYLYVLVGMSNAGLWDGEKANIEASVQTFKTN